MPLALHDRHHEEYLLSFFKIASEMIMEFGISAFKGLVHIHLAGIN